MGHAGGAGQGERDFQHVVAAGQFDDVAHTHGFEVRQMAREFL